PVGRRVAALAGGRPVSVGAGGPAVRRDGRVQRGRDLARFDTRPLRAGQRRRVPDRDHDGGRDPRRRGGAAGRRPARPAAGAAPGHRGRPQRGGRAGRGPAVGGRRGRGPRRGGGAAACAPPRAAGGGLVLRAALPVALDWSELHPGPERAGAAVGFLLLAGNLGGVVLVLIVQGVIGNPYLSLGALSATGLAGLALSARLPASAHD